jgi:hypothetical protein
VPAWDDYLSSTHKRVDYRVSVFINSFTTDLDQIYNIGFLEILFGNLYRVNRNYAQKVKGK